MTSFQLLARLLKELKVGPRLVALPLLLAFGAALFEGLGTGLLIPLLHGLVEGDFSFLWESSVGKWVVQQYPPLAELSSIKTFALVLTTVFIASFARILLSFLSDIAAAYRMREIEHKIRALLVSKVVTYGKGFFDHEKQGELHNRILGFTQHIIRRLQRTHVQMRWCLVLVMYGALMLYISWKLTVAVLLLLPFYHFPVSWIVSRIGNSSEKYADADSRISTTLYNILSCMPLIKVSAMEEEERDGFSKESQSAALHGYNIDKRMFFISPVHETVSLILIVILTALIAMIVLQDQSRDISAYLVFLYLLKRAATAFGTIADLRGMLASLRGHLLALNELLDTDGKSLIPDGSKDFPGLTNEIEFRGLSFAYTKEKPVLSNVHLTMKKGEVTALVGPSGGGKSTIGSLLLRFYDCEPGKIFLDGADIREFRITSLLRDFAYVSQDTYLFNDTFRNNISYGLETPPSKDELQSAIKAARLEDVVRSLPQGVESTIGDRGVQLSGGEKQRLSIARALLRNPKILILDEATSALDADTEQLIQEALDELVVGKTVLVIAHRFSTLRGAHEIYTLENGTVSESGTFDELVKAEGAFYNLWKAQDVFY